MLPDHVGTKVVGEIHGQTVSSVEQVDLHVSHLAITPIALDRPTLDPKEARGMRRWSPSISIGIYAYSNSRTESMAAPMEQSVSRSMTMSTT